ncbi:MAG TPA: hypothetical protein ENN91_02025, partial [Firmicutes bacterium]|nr:hypothetical protein [Bacillota bacterium]
FEGRPELATAAMRGEIDMVSSSVAGYASLIGDINAIVLMSDERHELLPDTPTLLEVGDELGKTAEFQKILPMGITTYMVGCPPGTPREVTMVLEEAFRSVIEDNEEFKAWAAEANMPAYFRGYDEINQMLNDVIAMLEEIDIVSIVEE